MWRPPEDHYGVMSRTNSQDLSSELRSLWRTRPVRTPDDSRIAGVCGGFGRRYGVDPVLFRVTFVVADTDPGWGNWIDTTGHTSGTALLRWVGATEHPLPTCRVVTL